MLPPANPFSRFAKTSAKKKELQPNGDDAQEEAAESASFEQAEEAGMKKAKK